MNRPVKAVMRRGVLTCIPETSITDAARQMVEHDVSALVVTDEFGRMVGLLSRTDMVRVRTQFNGNQNWRSLKVADLMVKNVISVNADDSLQVASDLIMQHHIHRVIVVENAENGQRPVGILSITDLVRDMALAE